MFKRIILIVLVALYLTGLMPPGGSHLGYSQDLCSDFVRQIMAETISQKHKIDFSTSSVMALPNSQSSGDEVAVPFMSWSVERDLIGALFWLASPEFPFQWIWFCITTIALIFFTSFWLVQVSEGRLSSSALDWLSAAYILFNVPRHFKALHHFEHLGQHWVYVGIMLDAWIWKRAVMDRRWDFKLEAWRLFALVGVFLTTGYFWGMTILAWMVFRSFLMIGLFTKTIKIEADIKAIKRPLGYTLVLIILLSFWFVPLFEAARVFGPALQWNGFYASLSDYFRPLWIWNQQIDHTETVVAVGTTYWLGIALATLAAMRVRKLMMAAPFLILTGIWVLFGAKETSDSVAPFFQSFVPFLKFVRVTSRGGLVLPSIMGALGLVSIPLILEYLKTWPRFGRASLYGMGVLFMSEAVWLAHPINVLPPMDPQTHSFLDRIKVLPGNTVLDLPFCVAGGNGICTAERCPNYPYSVIPQCLRQYHGKKIFGLYQARASQAFCDVYGGELWAGLFDAFKGHRCPTDAEFKSLCHYLGSQNHIGAILLYPEIWGGLLTRECVDRFESYLGKPLDGTSVVLDSRRDGDFSRARQTRIIRFAPKCQTTF